MNGEGNHDGDGGRSAFGELGASTNADIEYMELPSGGRPETMLVANNSCTRDAVGPSIEMNVGNINMGSMISEKSVIDAVQTVASRKDGWGIREANKSDTAARPRSSSDLVGHHHSSKGRAVVMASNKTAITVKHAPYNSNTNSSVKPLGNRRSRIN